MAKTRSKTAARRAVPSTSPAASPATSIASVIAGLERLAPSGTSEKWDNTGLLAGDLAWETRGAVVSVDLTEEAIRLAVRKGFRLIVNHHPCIFPKGRGPSRLVPGVRSGIPSLVFEAIRQGIAVAACHTNFDQCAMEVVQTVAHGLGVRARGRLIEAPESSLLKLVVFVPLQHAEKVREALVGAGAGHIGNYDSCTFGSAGEGTFRGGDATRPFLGRPGNLERAKEIRLETILPRGLKKPVLTALKAAHPYEEVAFDLYPVEQGPASEGLVRGLGYGFWGDFNAPKSYAEMGQDVRTLFKTPSFRLTDAVLPDTAPTVGNRKFSRVGFVAGKGESFIDAAIAVGCDLFITGEAGYHAAMEGARKGLSVLELGHRDSEVFFITTMEGWLAEMGLKTVGLNIKTQNIVSSAE
jgi:dinuclear metal center YbgI/SA1388 family protein